MERIATPVTNERSCLKIKGKTVVSRISGGMGVNISTAELALSVAGLGGMGHISDAMSPFVADKLYGTRYQRQKLRRFEHLVNVSDGSAINLDQLGNKLTLRKKMCLCYHFMQNRCYTSGYNVFRLKDTVQRKRDGSFLLPAAAEVFNDYVRLL